jgi:hypothetical protein
MGYSLIYSIGQTTIQEAALLKLLSPSFKGAAWMKKRDIERTRTL